MIILFSEIHKVIYLKTFTEKDLFAERLTFCWDWFSIFKKTLGVDI